MNIMIAAAGVDSGFAVGGGSLEETLAVAGFIVVGLILVFSGSRLARRHGRSPHAAHYTAPRL
jgi:hypothetical protein